MQARELWMQWEQRWSTLLLRDQGLVVAGNTRDEWARAMELSGAPIAMLESAVAGQLLPIASNFTGTVLWDQHGGTIEAQATVHHLRDGLLEHLEMSQVLDIGGHAATTVGGSWACDFAVVAAGVDTPELVSEHGINIERTTSEHARFTFRLRQPGANACLIDRGAMSGMTHAYGQPIGDDGYAIGASIQGEELDADQVAGYCREALPGLDPQPLQRLPCVADDYAFAPDGDGLRLFTSGGVAAIAGNNAFKFAPLAGEQVADVVHGGETPEWLRPR